MRTEEARSLMLGLERVYWFIIMLYPETQVTSPRIRQHFHIVLGFRSHLWMVDQLLVVRSPSWLLVGWIQIRKFSE